MLPGLDEQLREDLDQAHFKALAACTRSEGEKVVPFKPRKTEDQEKQKNPLLNRGFPWSGRLVVAVSEDPLTEAEWSRIDERISWYVEPSAVDDFNNNMWEASGGKIRFTRPPLGG